MKKILIIAFALFALQATAQNKRSNNKEFKKERRERLKNVSAEDMAKLQTKKMTLALDLTDAQQTKIEAINLRNAKIRKAKIEKRNTKKEVSKKMSQEDRLKLKNERLDKQIAAKREMKAILSPEQYQKYSEHLSKRNLRSKHGKMKRKRQVKRQQ